jgi:ABC-2 type transport system permease protein
VAGLGASALVAPSIVVPVIMLGANGIAWREAPIAWLLSSVLVIALVVVAGQLVTASLSAVLRSRRGRDLSVLIVAGIGVAGFAGQQVVRTAVDRMGLEAAVLGHAVNDYAWLLPPVAAQRVISDAAAGRPLTAALFALVTAAWVAGLAYLWHRVLRHLLTTPAQSVGPRRVRRTAGLSGRLGWNAPMVMARKELRFYLRDPRQRLVWTGAAIFIGLALASILAGSVSLGAVRSREWLPLLAPVLVLFVGLPIALNLFGWERNAASFLFVLPTGPRRLLIGKNMAAATALAVETAVLALILAGTSGAWSTMRYIPALGACAIMCQLAVGNLVSVVTPLRLPREGTDVFAQATEQGCLAIGAQLVSFFVIGALLVVPASIAVLDVSFNAQIPDLIVMTIAVAWGGLFYTLSLWLSGKLLARRMPEVAQWVQVV